MGKHLRRDRLRAKQLLRAKDAQPKFLALCSDSCRFEAAPAEGAKGPRRFTMLAYNGGPVKPHEWRFPVVIDLAGMETASRPKVFLEHDETKRVGHVDSVQVTDRQIRASGLVSASGAAAQEVLADADAGFPWDVSVGVRPLKVEWIPAGKTVRANGQTFEGPLNLFRRSRLFEISFVSMGADANTEVSISAGHKIQEHDMSFEDWLTAQGFSLSALDELQTKSLQALFDAEAAAVADAAAAEALPAGEKPAVKAKAGKALHTEHDEDGPSLTASMRAEAAKELKRQAMIRKETQKFPDLQAKAIEEDWDENKTRLEVLLASRPKGPAIHSAGGDQGEGYPQVLEAALCRTSMLNAKTREAAFDEKVLEAADARDLRGAGLHTLLFETIRLAGHHVRGGQMNDDTIRLAFRSDRELRASGAGFSTYSLAGILSNVQNKILLQSFLGVLQVIPEIASKKSTKDFKQTSSYRMTATGGFQAVSPTGEIKHLALDEDSFTNKLATVGGILQIARQDIINDDLGALNEISKILGRNAAIAREKAGFTKLLANAGSFFAAGNKNLLTGGTSALSIGGLTLGEQLFLDQTDKNGDPILLAPAILLVPTGLKVTAQQLMTETRVNETTTANVPKAGNNPHAGKWQPKSSPYLNGQALAGQSATAWYLFASPEDVAVLQALYLNGVDTPIIEMGEPNFDTLGMAIRGYYDFGIEMQDPKGGMKSNGV